MSSSSPKRIKPSEAFRGRALARYRGPLHDLVAPAPADGVDPTDASQAHVPRSSTDTALTSFAQLATLRLDASRALISLLDADNQYILAESTRSLSLQSDARHGAKDSLWLGSVTIPRSKGVCGLTLENALQTPSPAGTTEDNDGIFVINDLREDPRTASATFVVSEPSLRFYAGAPIRAPDGSVVGVLCIFDVQPRSELSEDQRTILRDLAKTTMDHLDALRVRRAYVRTNQLITGLESFVDGLTNTRTAEEAALNRTSTMPGPGNQLAAHDVAADTPSTDSKDASSTGQNYPDPNAPGVESKRVWELAMPPAMPPGSRPMFTRAANIIRQSGDYDGCAIFYVASGRRGRPSRSNLRADSPSSSHSATSPERHGDSSDTDDQVPFDHSSPHSVCPLLGYSLSSESTASSHSGPFPRFKRRDLEQLLGKDPRPRIYSLGRSGDVLPGDTSSSGSGIDQSDSMLITGGSETTDRETESTPRRMKVLRQHVKSLKKISPDALSYACLPLWDSERQRWLAYTICWTNSPSRHLRHDGDLGYLRVFGNSIAVALSHIDSITSNQAKGTFVSSISHELRSPLHGVLAATNFLKNDNMSRFEREMVAVISNCGRTLLDTLDHVMDFAKISSSSAKLRRRLSASTPLNIDLQPPAQDLHPSLSSNVNLSILIEEVIEAVLMGFNVQHDFVYADTEHSGSSTESPTFNSSAASLSQSTRMVNARGQVRLILQVPHRKNWHLYTQAGAWRRIIMNLFGNALKYTDSGMIIVRVDPQPEGSKDTLALRLNIVDTGKGISKHYMDTRLYTAFSQEDQLSSGTGLGLAIVRQVVASLGGSIQLNSSQGHGTTASVSLLVPTAPQISSLMDAPDLDEGLSERLKSRRIYVLDDSSLTNGDIAPQTLSHRADVEFFQSLSLTLKDWFGVDVSHGASWPTDNADIIICLKPVLKYFDKSAGDVISRQPVLLVTYDALEMAVLRTDARISRSDAVIEVTSQPLGPQKLARMLKQCLDRQERLLAMNSGSDLSLPYLSAPRTDLPTPRSPTPVQHPTSGSAGFNHVSSEMYRDPFVLIVDDNQLNLRLLSFFMKRQSLKYHEAHDGQEAVDIFRAAMGSVRCILMDISMPVLDGIAATKLIRDLEQQGEKQPRTTIIALTGLTSAASRSEAQEAGMDEFLTKPLSFSQLTSILGQIKGL